MKLCIQQYWESLEPMQPGEELCAVIKGQFEAHGSVSTSDNGGGWSEKLTWERSCRGRHGFIKFTEGGHALFHLNTYYGIRSYQAVWLGEPAGAPTPENVYA